MAIREAVAEYLADGREATLNDIHFGTSLPLASLRTHLHLNIGVHYGYYTTGPEGFPERRWYLIPDLRVDVP